MSDGFYDGEVPLKDAPSIKLKNGANCVPQHFLRYQHNLASVQKIVLGCHFDERYPIFVGEDKQCIYIQVGVIGYDNYKDIVCQSNQKIVYGRRWRVEPDLPTSEIIQTVFLALKKAREHEVREVFKLTIRGRTTTPFSTHQDLPLMVNNAHLVKGALNNELTLTEFAYHIRQILLRIRYDNSRIELIDIEERSNGNILVDLKMKRTQWTQFEEVKDISFTSLVKRKCVNALLFELMDTFIQFSDRYIEEHFSFEGFKRFSRFNDIQEISELSLETRDKKHIQDSAFQLALDNVNYETDKNRVPDIVDVKLAKKIAKNLSSFGKLDGILPSL